MTTYSLGAIRCETETMDPQTRRYVRHEPRTAIDLQVGNRAKFERLPLSEEKLLSLIEQASQALQRMKAQERVK